MKSYSDYDKNLKEIYEPFWHEGLGFIALKLIKNDESVFICAAELLLIAFVERRPEHHIVDYKDGNPKNLVITNLRWKLRVDK